MLFSMAHGHSKFLDGADMRSFLLTILALVALALPMASAANAQGEPSLQLAKSRQIFSGSYKVYGTNRNGSKYKGKAVIAVAGNKVEMSWLITSGQTYKGKGTIKNGRMVVDFGGSAPIIYTIDEAGILHGKWDRGRASEMLVPE